MIPFDWYVNRFRAMSIREILGMRAYRFVRDALAGSAFAKLPEALESLDLKIDGFPGSDRDRFLECFPGRRERILREAEGLLANRIPLFGREVDFGETIDWNADFVTGRKWPSGGVDYRSAEIGDPKDVWELNRQQFLPVLGRAFFLGGDERYAEKAATLIESWIDGNPPAQGINWASGIELALRQISWIWTLKFLSSSQYATAAFRRKVAGSMFLQTRHIARNLSLYSSANNHLISELAAMVLVGTALGRKKWVEEAERRLGAEIDRQILLDGVGAEQSPSYQLHTMEHYLLATLAQGRVAPEAIRKGLERGAEYLRSISDSRGDPPPMGDDDSGTVLRLSEGYANCKTVLNLVAALTGTPGFLRDDVHEDEKTFWLLGGEKFASLASRTSAGRGDPPWRRTFEEGGCYILEKNLGGKKVRLLFDCGPLGMKPMAGHGHSDALGFLLYLDGEPVFIDPGTYAYHKGRSWRNYFRGTSAHNTVRLDGADQSVHEGTFLSLRHADARCDGREEGRYVAGSHNGYRALESPAIHRRSVSFDEAGEGITIEDRIESPGSHLVEQFFHLDGRCVPREVGRNLFSIDAPSGRVTLSFDPRMEPSVYFGDDVLPLGWQSPSYGVKEKTFTLAGRSRPKGKAVFVTRIGL